MTTELIRSSAVRLVRMIRERKISCLELMQEYVDRAQDVNKDINALVQTDYERALDAAAAAQRRVDRGEDIGPLHGLPVSIKDALDTRDFPTTCGIPQLSDYTPSRDATAVRRIREAGGIIFGKTNVPTLLLTPETENPIYGRTSNPYNLKHSAGGSSGGEAAAVAACASAMGLGSDAGGSIRVPAHYCGAAGLKPTRGRVPATGHTPPNMGFGWYSEIGPVARHVEDLYLGLQVISGKDDRDPDAVSAVLSRPDSVPVKSLRAAYYAADDRRSPTQQTEKVLTEAVSALRDAGVSVTERMPPGLDQISVTVDRLMSHFETTLDVVLPDINRRSVIDPGVVDRWICRVQGSRGGQDSISSGEYYLLTAKLQALQKGMLAFLEEYDVILSPVSTKPAPRHGFSEEEGNIRDLYYTLPYNWTKTPAVSLRAGTSPEGLPIGLQIIARPWEEDVALSVAKIIEESLGGWRPPAL